MLSHFFTASHLLLLVPLLLLFFTPPAIALRRNATHYEWIALSNVVAGATGLRWIVVLIWALYDRPRPAVA